MKGNGMKTGWTRIAMLALALVLTMAFGLYGPGAAAKTQTITYINEDGDTVTTEAEVLTSDTRTLANRGVYTADRDLTIKGRVNISGLVTIVLQDGVMLDIPKGITVSCGKTLTICGQENNTGRLIINTVKADLAGIGGEPKIAAGKIIIAGGRISVRGGKNAAGIGSGYHGRSGGNVLITGGSVNAKGGSGAPYGIGHGKDGNYLTAVTITGGQITADGISSKNINLSMNDEDGYIWNKGAYSGDVTVNGVLRVADSGEKISGIVFDKSVIYEKKLVGESLTVTFDSKGGSAVEKQSVKYGETVSEPSAPTRENARFVEWRRGASTWSFDTPVTTSITLTAVWEFVDGVIPVSAASDFSSKRGQDGSYVLKNGMIYRLPASSAER